MPDAASARPALEPPPRRLSRGLRLWRHYLIVGAIAALGYLAIPGGWAPSGWVADLLYWTVAASAALAIVVGLRRQRPSLPAPWRLLAAALVVYLAGDVSFDFLGSYPAVADVLYLGFYPFVVVALVLLVRGRAPGGDRPAVTDAAIVAVSIGLVAWVFLIDPMVQVSDVSLARRLVLVAYPIMDMLILAVAARLVAGPGYRQPAFHLLVAGLAALLVTDTVYILLEVHGAYAASSLGGRLLDGGWMVFYVLVGAAALHPSMRSVAQEPFEPEQGLRPRMRRLATMAALSLLAPAVLVVQQLRGVPVNVLAVAAAWGVLFLLLVVRMADLLRELEAGAARSRAQEEELRAALDHLEDVEHERRRLLDRTIRSGEEERSRLAAELHDGPIQRLTALVYSIDESRMALEFGNPQHAVELLGIAHQVLASEIGELRRLMTALRPPVLDQRGLVLALRDLLDEFQRRTRIGCTLLGERDVELDPELETVLYRVVQEALTNVAKHARAQRVTVYLRSDDGQVEARISDDGVGFDAGSSNRMTGQGHYGLAGMRERVEMAGGSYRLISAPGYGTVVLARVPCQRVMA